MVGLIANHFFILSFVPIMLFEAYDALLNIVKDNIAIGTNINPLFNNTFLFFDSIIIPPFFLEQLIYYSIFRKICQIQPSQNAHNPVFF